MSINESQDDPVEWYAIQVKSRYEKAIATTLISKGFEAFVPTSRSARKNESEPKQNPWQTPNFPLFPGYVFGRFEVKRRLPILITPGVYSIVGYGKVPAAIPETEILAIQTVVEEQIATEPCAFPTHGSRVRVKAGPLAGIEGTLLETRSSCRFVLSVSTIQRSVRIEIDGSMLELIEEERLT